MTQPLRFCTWNIQLGLQLDKILAALRDEADLSGLDILALQEASVHGRKEDAQVIAETLGPEYEYFQVTAHTHKRFVQANAVVWNTRRLHVTHREVVDLPRARELKLSRTEGTLLRALRSQRRNSIFVEGARGAETLRVYAAHLDVVGFAHKREQFSRIVNDAQGRAPVDLTILAGDLNTFRVRSFPKWSGMVSDAEAAGLHDLTSEIHWTHAVRSIRLKQKLDAIFVGGRRPLRYRSWSLDIAGSDHIPVLADIANDEA